MLYTHKLSWAKNKKMRCLLFIRSFFEPMTYYFPSFHIHSKEQDSSHFAGYLFMCLKNITDDQGITIPYCVDKKIKKNGGYASHKKRTDFITLLCSSHGLWNNILLFFLLHTKDMQTPTSCVRFSRFFFVRKMFILCEKGLFVYVFVQGKEVCSTPENRIRFLLTMNQQKARIL